jgi:hypothetical protein
MPDLRTMLLADAGVTAIAVSKTDLAQKAAVGYVFAPGTSVLCGECAYIQEDLCTDHPGPEQFVSLETGSCNDWQDRRAGPVLGNHSRAWLMVAYAENDNGFGCRRCIHMGYPKRDCNAVDKDSPGLTPGEIHPYGCCNLWERDPTRGGWPEARFQNA